MTEVAKPVIEVAAAIAQGVLSAVMTTRAADISKASAKVSAMSVVSMRMS